MSGFVHSCELKGLWLLAQRLTNVSLYKYREFLLRIRYVSLKNLFLWGKKTILVIVFILDEMTGK